MTASEFLDEYKSMKYPHTLSRENIELLLNNFGKIKWIEAQKDANGYRMDKFGDNGKYPAATMTPYKK